MAKVIHLAPSFNNETSDLSNTLLKHQQAVAEKTIWALEWIPWINTLQLTQQTKQGIIETFENADIHPSVVNKLEQKSAFDPTAVDNKLTQDEVAMEMEKILPTDEFKYWQQLQAA